MEIANEYTHYSKHYLEPICELYKIDNANYNRKVLMQPTKDTILQNSLNT